MDEIITWMNANADWLWLSVGVGLLIGEMLIPGIYMLWIGLASLATGALVWLIPGFEFELQGMAFTSISILLVFLAHRYFYTNTDMQKDNGENRHGQNHVGKTYIVVNAIENGRGHIKVGDTRWLAEGNDAPVGAKVLVEAIEGTVMKVVPVE
jgi:membrane protein implicated in regulation of membrane protease activity